MAIEATTDRSLSTGFDAVSTALGGKATEAIAAETVRTMLIATNAATAVASGMYTRSRAVAGKEPILKLLF